MDEQPEKLRPIPEEWQRHITEIKQQITEGEARVLALEGQISRIRRDQEFMRTHLAEAIKVLGGGMTNPRLSVDGSSIEGD